MGIGWPSYHPPTEEEGGSVWALGSLSGWLSSKAPQTSGLCEAGVGAGGACFPVKCSFWKSEGRTLQRPGQSRGGHTGSSPFGSAFGSRDKFFRSVDPAPKSKGMSKMGRESTLVSIPPPQRDKRGRGEESRNTPWLRWDSYLWRSQKRARKKKPQKVKPPSQCQTFKLLGEKKGKETKNSCHYLNTNILTKILHRLYTIIKAYSPGTGRAARDREVCPSTSLQVLLVHLPPGMETSSVTQVFTKESAKVLQKIWGRFCGMAVPGCPLERGPEFRGVSDRGLPLFAVGEPGVELPPGI